MFKFQAERVSGNGDLYYELDNGYNVGQELCLGAATTFFIYVSHRNVSFVFY